MRRLLVSLALLSLFTACTAATKTAKLTASPQDAMRCAAETMQALGYSVTDTRPADGVLQGERDKHARIPFGGNADWDRITVLVSDSAKDPAIRVVGETLRTSGASPFGAATGRARNVDYEGMPIRYWTSDAVRNDTARIAETCSGVAPETSSEKTAEGGS